MFSSLPVIAGIASTAIFVGSVMPMLGKALRTRELGSYSLGNLLMANLGNAVHSVYVFSLAPGPLWVLHGFHQCSTALMLVWFVRYELRGRRRSGQPERAGVDDDGATVGDAELGEDRRDVMVGSLG